MKKIALINDLSGFGRCSLTAAIPIISVLGVQACPLPTAILSSQTGFDSYYYDDYTSRMNAITDEWVKMNEKFDGIYSGYLGNETQIENVRYFLDNFHDMNTLYLCDPIMGDGGKRFPMCNDAFLRKMRALCNEADVITPNLTELCLLCDVDYDEIVKSSNDNEYEDMIADIAYSFMENANRDQTIIVTGILSNGANGDMFISNLAVAKEDICYTKTPYTGKSFSGTGDLFASVVAGCIVKGISVEDAVKKAVEFISPAITEATNNNENRNHGVYFEKYLKMLL